MNSTIGGSLSNSTRHAAMAIALTAVLLATTSSGQNHASEIDRKHDLKSHPVAGLAQAAASGSAASQPAGQAATHTTPAVVYVSNGGGGITEIDASNHSVIATAPFPNNANGVVVTPDGRRMYATNRDVAKVTVFDTESNVPLTDIPVGNGNDNLGLAVTPDGSFVYVANQFSGTVTVIATATNTVVKTIATGAEPIWITVSPDGSRAYVSNQASGSVSVVGTASNNIIATIYGFACPFESQLTGDGAALLVSSQCDGSVKVVSIAANAIVNSIPAGGNPRGIAISPDGSRAYVADFFSNTINVLDVQAQTNLNAPIQVGSNPWGVAMTPDGTAYVANFGDNTVSAINTNSNAVVATLPARGNPEDVTVSTAARPAVLNFAFQTVDVPNAVETIPFALNTLGALVGMYTDGAGTTHGFLRSPDGTVTKIDPPGAAFSQAVSINDAGLVVGDFEDGSTGLFHGYKRDPGGAITIIDVPGAVDSAALGINDASNITGSYDTGNQATNIGFLLRRSVFTSFEDPSAAPAETLPVGINNLGEISGLFMDTSGNDHAFLRSPDGARLQTIDFPQANSSDGFHVNDRSAVVGQYITNFPLHGFVFAAGRFVSIDFPDSRNGGLRGINDRGQMAGFYRTFESSARHGFIATPRANP